MRTFLSDTQAKNTCVFFGWGVGCKKPKDAISGPTFDQLALPTVAPTMTDQYDQLLCKSPPPPPPPTRKDNISQHISGATVEFAETLIRCLNVGGTRPEVGHGVFWPVGFEFASFQHLRICVGRSCHLKIWLKPRGTHMTL
ncbi:hypothetical protein DFH94DRAFT_846402, partial [Russula ochroleuca]